MFIYAPLALFGFIAFLQRKDKFYPRSFAFTGLIFVTALLLVHSSYWGWHGDRGWGPRLNLMTIPFFYLSTGSLLSSPDCPRYAKHLAIILGLLGFFLQIPVVVIGMSILYQYLGYADMAAFNTDPTSFSISDDLILSHYVPDLSPVVIQFKILSAMVTHGSQFVMDFSELAGDSGSYRIPGFIGPKIPFKNIAPDFWFWTKGDQPISVFSFASALFMLLAGLWLLNDSWRASKVFVGVFPPSKPDKIQPNDKPNQWR